jgi:DDE superfamily endonuclease
MICRRRKGEPKGFAWQDYQNLIIATHRQLGAPVIWCWDNLNIHLAPELAEFAAENKAWLRVFQLPTYAPELNPAEGIWSLLKRAIANFAAPNLDYLVRIVKRKLKKIQYRPHLISGCLTATGLTIDAPPGSPDRFGFGRCLTIPGLASRHFSAYYRPGPASERGVTAARSR